MKKKNNDQSCCRNNNKKKYQPFLMGLVYGLIPHIGCISFIVLTIFGTTIAVAFLKPILYNTYFFPLLIFLSFSFATLSAVIYLKINKSLSFSGIKDKRNYLFTLYFSTILINLLLIVVVFPYITNVMSSKIAASRIFAKDSQQALAINVNIPCSGHASLITEELYKINGVKNVNYQYPNKFVINYDFNETSKEKILSLNIFNTYKIINLDNESGYKKLN